LAPHHEAAAYLQYLLETQKRKAEHRGGSSPSRRDPREVGQGTLLSVDGQSARLLKIAMKVVGTPIAADGLLFGVTDVGGSNSDLFALSVQPESVRAGQCTPVGGLNFVQEGDITVIDE
jgi:hypothetical protein